MESAHRIALALQSIEDGYTSLPIGNSLEAAHNCPGGDNKRCVNPDHLRWMTHAEHCMETSAKGQVATGDRNGSRTKPESRPRGDRNGARTKPESRARGIEHGMATVLDEDAARLVVRVLDGEANAAVARDAGMPEPTLHHWVQGVCRPPVLARAKEIIGHRGG